MPKPAVPRRTRVVQPAAPKGYARPATVPLEKAETLRPFVGDLKDRCVDCRRPNGAHLIGWRSGYYGLWLETYLALFTPRGELVTDKKELLRHAEDADCQVVTVALDDRGRCRRCAHLHARTACA